MFWCQFATTTAFRKALSNNKTAMFKQWIPESAPNFSSNVQSYVYHILTFPWQHALDSLQNVCKMEKGVLVILFKKVWKDLNLDSKFAMLSDMTVRFSPFLKLFEQINSTNMTYRVIHQIQTLCKLWNSMTKKLAPCCWLSELKNLLF